MENPNFKTGRYSKHLPSKLAAHFQEAQSDPEILSHREEVALLGSLIAERLENFHAESAQLWTKAAKLFADFKTADPAHAFDILSALGETLEKGCAEAGNRREVVTLASERRKHAEAEMKRLVAMDQMMTAEQAMVFLAAVVESVRRNVVEPGVRAAIGRDIERLTLIADRNPLPAGPVGGGPAG